MPDPITTLGLAKTASDLFKETLEIARNAKDANLSEKLIDLYRDFLLLVETNQELRNEVQQLKNELETKATMSFKHGVYYQEGDHVPYCPTCYENDRRVIHLRSWDGGKGDHWRCMVCMNSAYLSSAVKE